jgi:hypothetical protein
MTSKRGLTLSVAIISIGFVFCSMAFGQETLQIAGEKPVAVKVFEVGNVRIREFSKIWTQRDWDFYDGETPFYIVNYGSDRDMTQRERVITAWIASRNFERSRITLVRGGGRDARTVVWKVPYGAANPKP